MQALRSDSLAMLDIFVEMNRLAWRTRDVDGETFILIGRFFC